MSDTHYQREILGAPAQFDPTCWTKLAAAGDGDEQSLGEFCQRYWHPLYAFARRSGQDPANAQDLTQSFFSWLIENQALTQAEAGHGRFRNFLLIQFKRFIYKDYRKQHAQKRGGHLAKIDFSDAEELLGDDSILEPEKVFDKSWALNLLDKAMSELEQQFVRRDETARFKILRGFIDSSHELSRAAAAQELDCTENALKVSVHRFRSQFRQQLRHQVELTLSPGENIDEEMHYLAELLRS